MRQTDIKSSSQRGAPPDAEWWDAALLPTKTYDDLAHGVESLNIRNNGSPITIYIQHPIPIPAPGDKNKVALKPLKLTKKVWSDVIPWREFRLIPVYRSKRSYGSNGDKPSYRINGIESGWG